MFLALGILTLLMVKHTFVDFVLQGPYMYLNKGKILHPGGWLHALLHGGATSVILLWTNIDRGFSGTPLMLISILGVLALTEVLYHFIVDFSKVNICKYFGWTATTSEYFWWATGIDQFLHFLSYVLITLFYVTLMVPNPF